MEMQRSPALRHSESERAISRRDALTAGGLSAFGLSLADVLRQRALSGISSPSDTSVIVVWLQGGPSHLETFDPKPEAPAEFRGEFRAIPSATPGLQLCELLPKLAATSRSYSVIRSIAHQYNDHGRGTWRVLTGRHEQPQRNIDGPPEFPEAGSVVNWSLQRHRLDVPQFTVIGRRIFRQGHAYLGPAYAPFVVEHDLESDQAFRIRNLTLMPQLVDRLDDRRTLRRTLDLLRRDVDQSGVFEAIDGFEQQAVEMLTSPRVRTAFNLDAEPERVRQLYGRHKWGDRALLARRLVEAGCSLVHVVMSSVHKDGKVGTQFVNWDDHGNGAGERRSIFVSMRDRLPVLDHVIPGLIQDVYARGLDQRVMVVVMGEFGRSPRIYTQNPKGYPGREHWNRAMSVLVSGGGTRTGQVIGATTAKGEEPRERRLDPADLMATIYRFLGIDYHQEVNKGRGQVTRILPRGTPIAELT